MGCRAPARRCGWPTWPRCWWRPARPTRSGGEELLEAALETGVAHRTDLERELEALGGGLRASARGRRGALGQPHHARVVGEVGVSQLRPAVQAQLADHRVLEGAGEEVGEEVRAGLLVECLLDLVAADDVVAVVAGQALGPG